MSPQFKNVFDVAHSMQYTDDLNGLGLRVVNDEIGVDSKEFQWPFGKILPHMPGAWLGPESD